MEFLRAEGGGIIPILVIWGVMMVFGQIQKAKKRAAQQQQGQSHDGPPAAQRGLLDELTRAMQELKQVERDQERKGEPGGLQVMDSRAKAYLADRKRHVTATERFPTRRTREQVFVPQVHHPTFDEDGSIEGAEVTEGADVTEGVEEGTDYDFESQRMASERRAQTAVNWHDGQGPVDTLHTALGSPAEVSKQSAKSPLARYADGTARSALILSLILGPPRSES